MADVETILSFVLHDIRCDGALYNRCFTKEPSNRVSQRGRTRKRPVSVPEIREIDIIFRVAKSFAMAVFSSDGSFVHPDVRADAVEFPLVIHKVRSSWPSSFSGIVSHLVREPYVLG